MTDLATRLALLTPDQRQRLRQLLDGDTGPSLRPGAGTAAPGTAAPGTAAPGVAAPGVAAATPGTGGPTPPPTPVPLTPGQLRLWRTQQDHPGMPIDVVCQAVRLTGPVDTARLADDLAGFAARHEALRTTFAVRDGMPVATVHDRLSPQVRQLSCPGGREQAHQLARALATEPFDLAGGPLLRAAIATVGPAEHYLLLAVHNLVFDAWSFEVLLDELAAPPAAPALSFSDFARWQDGWVHSPAGRRAAGHWAAALAGAPPPLPGAGPQRSYAGARHEFTLPAEVGAGLAELAREQATTPFTAWSAVVWALLGELSGRPDVLFGTFAANRDQPNAAGIVGYLLNVLPVRLRDPGGGSLRERVRHARGPLRDGQRFGAYPAELLAVRPLDVVFVFDNFGAGARRTIHGAEVLPADVDRGTARYDLTISVYIGPEGPYGWVEYDTGRYDAAGAARLADRFTQLARAGAADPDAVLPGAVAPGAVLPDAAVGA